ncbi:hypothetical protein Xen7305DRAFT_00016850 [Xenococcus sp. PCC 7305]|uniref:hypothetical protein n=1 Tax=Xenococcus sp. PCC 7305 TaxID=102125 RepID=UPI0002AC7707|nr:hypothetical protein [Xenococcus sp. PCC 7305]ELS01976.1 hypothetical protein Xen7305DRAFT_00016850 [Xenococcus sp. PCC 7305]
MVTQDSSADLAQKFPSLSLTISKLLDKREKNYGTFQVAKEAGFYSLYIPSLPSFKLYQNDKSHIYKGYWREYGLPDLKDRSCKPDLVIRKKQKQVPLRKTNKLIKQRIYEIVYKYDTSPEIRSVNQLLASFIQSKIESSMSSASMEEMMPLVLKKEI